MKELSIFVDESGDFGAYDHHCPIYLFSLVYHDQSLDISALTKSFQDGLSQIDAGMTYFHAGPLIRREGEYKEMDVFQRRKAFNKMSYLTKNLPISYSVVSVEKTHISGQTELSNILKNATEAILLENLTYFQSFDCIKIYYDNGQRQLLHLLKTAFASCLGSLKINIVKPTDYILFQVADFLTTIELTRYKFQMKTISSSELHFFNNAREFHRNFYRGILSKRL